MLTLTMIAWYLFPIVAPSLIALTMLALVLAAPTVTIAEPAVLDTTWTNLEALDLGLDVIEQGVCHIVPPIEAGPDTLRSVVDCTLHADNVYYAHVVPPPMVLHAG